MEPAKLDQRLKVAQGYLIENSKDADLQRNSQAFKKFYVPKHLKGRGKADDYHLQKLPSTFWDLLKAQGYKGKYECDYEALENLDELDPQDPWTKIHRDNWAWLTENPFQKRQGRTPKKPPPPPPAAGAEPNINNNATASPKVPPAGAGAETSSGKAAAVAEAEPTSSGKAAAGAEAEPTSSGKAAAGAGAETSKHPEVPAVADAEPTSKRKMQVVLSSDDDDPHPPKKQKPPTPDSDVEDMEIETGTAGVVEEGEAVAEAEGVTGGGESDTAAGPSRVTQQTFTDLGQRLTAECEQAASDLGAAEAAAVAAAETRMAVPDIQLQQWQAEVAAKHEEAMARRQQLLELTQDSLSEAFQDGFFTAKAEAAQLVADLENYKQLAEQRKQELLDRFGGAADQINQAVESAKAAFQAECDHKDAVTEAAQQKAAQLGVELRGAKQQAQTLQQEVQLLQEEKKQQEIAFQQERLGFLRQLAAHHTKVVAIRAAAGQGDAGEREGAEGSVGAAGGQGEGRDTLRRRYSTAAIQQQTVGVGEGGAAGPSGAQDKDGDGLRGLCAAAAEQRRVSEVPLAADSEAVTQPAAPTTLSDSMRLKLACAALERLIKGNAGM